MTTNAPTDAEISAFARRHGLDKLAPAHLARMRELAVHVADLGRTLPRVAAKDQPPAFDHSDPDPH